MECYYNFANFPEVAKEQLYNNNIGVLDLESMKNRVSFDEQFIRYNDEEGKEQKEKNKIVNESEFLGIGEHIIYAGG
jgi:hypothetical protein